MIRRIVVECVMGVWLCGVPMAARAQAPAAEPGRTVAGIVVESDTRAPIAGAVVGTDDARVTTDDSGRFTLRVPAGLAAVEVSAAGHFGLSVTLDVRTADALGAELALARVTGFATTVDVVAAAPASAPATERVQPLQVLRTPGALDNVYRTLQTLPGVAATEEFSSRLAVRGGAPDQNLTVMDGVEVHDPYRLFGLTSAFNPEIIQRFELATGGFSVAYGDRLSSLLTVENREGVRDRRFAGSGALSITDSNVVLEGALPGQATGSWLVTGRRTYYDVVAAKVTGNDFPGFVDLQAKGVWEPRPGRRLTFFGLRSRETAAFLIDGTTAQGTFEDDTRNDLLSTDFDTAIGSRGRLHSVAAYSNTRSVFGVDAAVENTSQRSNAPSADAVGIASVVFARALAVRDFSLRQELAWAIGRQVVEVGAEAHRLETSLRYDITGDRNPAAVNGSSVQGGAGLPDSLRSSGRTTRGGVWVQETRQIGTSGSVQAGLRVDRVGFTGETRLSPRVLGLRRLGSATRLKAALGRYTQSPGYEKLAQSDYVLDFTNSAVSDLRSERAVQASAGIERDLAPGVLLRAEGYYKRLSDLLIGRLETEAERGARIARYDFPAALVASVPTDPIITTVPTNDGAGHAYGIDLFLSRTSAPAAARLTGWASYTWGRATRDAYGYQYPFEYDRQHAFAMVSALRLTPRWELAATTRVASGFPRTAPVGLRIAGEEDRLDRDRDGITDEILPARNATGLPVYAVDFGSVATLNRARLPLFARVDVRATWKPRGASGRWELYLEAINALNRRNAGAIEPRLEYDPTSSRPRIVEKRSESVPLLPTVGLRFRF